MIPIFEVMCCEYRTLLDANNPNGTLSVSKDIDGNPIIEHVDFMSKTKKMCRGYLPCFFTRLVLIYLDIVADKVRKSALLE
jgi:hypothetical protein